jgi:hypothetical protein
VATSVSGCCVYRVPCRVHCFVPNILHVCSHRLYWAQAAKQHSLNVKRVLFTSNKKRGSDILGAFPYSRKGLLASLRPSVRLSVCLHVSSRLPLDGRVSVKFLLQIFVKTCRESPNVVKIGQNFRSPYVET